ncbi:MAG: tetratricopeptide repeat protein [Spirochaetes bacterium]|nr:tetratricopeptide repeat protein [Spirochaetota bacterium]
MTRSRIIAIFFMFTLTLLPAGAGLYAQFGVPAPAPATGAALAQTLYNRGRNYMFFEDWYSAIEVFLEGLRHNPAHAGATAALAESYYELGEFDQALHWVRRARTLSRGNMDAANLEAVTLIALGHLDPAAQIISYVLGREPWNREALFALAELDIARGHQAQALFRFREAVRRMPDDRRLLVSLALVSGSMGDNAAALDYINRALVHHPDDFRVHYYAAYINAQSNMLSNAIFFANNALMLRPDHLPTVFLMANLRYRAGHFEEAARLADTIIASEPGNQGAWYLRGLSYSRLGFFDDAIAVFSNALAINGENEFIRAVLEQTLLSSTNMEDPRRERWAQWRFQRARYYDSRNLLDQALFEYQRGLRLYPFSPARREFAEILRLQRFHARYLEELRFLQDMGMGDQQVTDAVAAYASLLGNSVFRQWQVNPLDLAQRHWNVAIFSLTEQSSFHHADSGYVAASIIREFLIHDRNIAAANIGIRQPSFSQAFRLAREQGADYFMIVSVQENERDISIRGELFVGRTGAPAGTFSSYRTGPNRLRNSTRGIVEQLSNSLPLRGRLVMRRLNEGLIDMGRADGVQVGMVYDIVRVGVAQTAHDGIALVYAEDDIVGRILIESVDDEVASGTITRIGFFDRIEVGDEVILQRPRVNGFQPEIAANPELRALLRTLR